MTLHTPVYMQPVSGDASIPFSGQELRRNLQALLSVFSPAAQAGVTPLDGQFAVTQHAAGANFSVDVAAGHAFVVGSDVANQSAYGCWNDAVVNVTVPSPPASGTEVHRLVLQIEDKFNNALWTGYTANLTLLADTGSGTPAAPASSITLALISVAAGQASVLNANINDQRTLLPLTAGTSWQNMSLSSGWTLGSGGYAQYKVIPYSNMIAIRGENLIPGTLADGTHLWTIAPGYVPTQPTQPVAAIVRSGTALGTIPRLEVTSTGTINIYDFQSSANALYFSGSYALS